MERNIKNEGMHIKEMGGLAARRGRGNAYKNNERAILGRNAILTDSLLYRGAAGPPEHVAELALSQSH